MLKFIARMLSGTIIALGMPLCIGHAAPVAPDLSVVYLYPTPFKPFGPNAGTGAAQTGTLAGGVTFTNLPASGHIKIYNTQGEIKKDIEFSALSVPSYAWDFKDSSSQLLPDDMYYAVVSSGTSSKTIYFSKGIGDPGTTITRNCPPLQSGTISVNTYDAVGSINGSMTFVVRGAEEGKVTLVGGAKGFVNPTSGEKLTIGAKATGSGAIKTTIYDGNGRAVRSYSVPTDGSQPVVVQWDGKDSSGRTVSSGVYVIHVDGPGLDITKRTVIIK